MNRRKQKLKARSLKQEVNGHEADNQCNYNAVALVLAFFERSLIVVALGSMAIVYLASFFIV